MQLVLKRFMAKQYLMMLSRRLIKSLMPSQLLNLRPADYEFDTLVNVRVFLFDSLFIAVFPRK
jgi:hypothetical protein